MCEQFLSPKQKSEAGEDLDDSAEMTSESRDAHGKQLILFLFSTSSTTLLESFVNNDAP